MKHVANNISHQVDEECSVWFEKLTYLVMKCRHNEAKKLEKKLKKEEKKMLKIEEKKRLKKEQKKAKKAGKTVPTTVEVQDAKAVVDIKKMNPVEALQYLKEYERHRFFEEFDLADIKEIIDKASEDIVKKDKSNKKRKVKKGVKKTVKKGLKKGLKMVKKMKKKSKKKKTTDDPNCNSDKNERGRKDCL